jgi:plastocyanin
MHTSIHCLSALLLAFFALNSAAGSVQLTVTDPAGKPIPDAVVFLDSAQARTAVKPQAGVEVEQVSKQFAPRVTVVPVGSSLAFPNRDTVRHHVYSFSPVKTFDLKLYAGTPANPVLFDKPGIVVLGCNIHDQMLAWVVVVETPYFGKTNAAGQISLPTAPAGNYALKVWHPGLPTGAQPQEQALVVTQPNQSITFALKGAAL